MQMFTDYIGVPLQGPFVRPGDHCRIEMDDESLPPSKIDNLGVIQGTGSDEVSRADSKPAIWSRQPYLPFFLAKRTGLSGLNQRCPQAEMMLLCTDAALRSAVHERWREFSICIASAAGRITSDLEKETR